MKEGRRVAITGIGIVSPAGSTLEEFWKVISSGRSCVGPITRFDAGEFRVKIAAEVKDFAISEKYLDRKEARRLDLFLQYAIVASGEALKDAGVKGDALPVDSGRVAVVIGSGIGGIKTIEDNCRILVERGPSRVSPHFIPYSIGNMASGLVAIKFGLKGPNLCVTTACSSGAHAVGEAARMIRHGYADAALAGASEAAITPLAIGGFAAMRALSERNDEPEKASRPFDKHRDGFVMGEGAAVLFMESEDAARARGARIYAFVEGYAANGDAFHITAPDETGRGAAECMRMALKDAGISPSQVQYINAHGTSTPLNDKIETKAIKDVFAEHAYKLAVSSTKSVTGHLLGAAGSIETAAVALALFHQFAPPTANLETPDEECDLDYVPLKGRKLRIEYALNNSFGFGGTNACLVLRRAD